MSPHYDQSKKRPPLPLYLSRVMPVCLVLLMLGSLLSQTTRTLARAETTAPATNYLRVSQALLAPELDGTCADAAYADGTTVTLTNAAGQEPIAGKLVHSTRDLYLCFDLLPAAGQQVAVRVDGNYSRDQVSAPGDYVFSVASNGSVKTLQGDGKGAYLPMTVPQQDVAAVTKQDSSAGPWSAEVRISLEWFGGYARLDGAQIAAETSNGTPLQQWPATALASSPATWGELELGPRYSDKEEAGSVFVDGKGSYLVVPYSPELNPPELTVEAWVRVVNGDCGTLVGNGLSTSYWLALCEGIYFGHGGVLPTRGNLEPLTDGWHHVAVTMALPMIANGERKFYIDGELVAHVGWEPEESYHPRAQPEEEARLGSSDRMLRVGSDRDATEVENYLQGYVRELRIWNRVRTADEIRAAAFQSLHNPEPGLVSVWPFTNGLQDVVGGHDAGLIGSAELSPETPDVTAFPASIEAVAGDYSPSEPSIAAWDSQLPQVATHIELDGVCSTAEYADAARVRLEPNHALTMRMLIDQRALYLCTNVQFGATAPGNSITLLLDRAGNGGQVPDADDLRVHLTPDGTVSAATGSAAGYTEIASDFLTSKTISDTEFALQEDLRVIAAPWWSSEVRIPLTSLEPFVPGDALHLALRYEGSIPEPRPAELPWEQLLEGSWPASFDELQPATWGIATTGGASSADLAATDDSGGATIASPVYSILPNQLPMPSSRPTSSNFDSACPTWKYPLFATDPDAKWPMVSSGSYPVVRTEGVMQQVYVSNWDSPFLHDSNSHDVDMYITPNASSANLMLSGHTSQVLESETSRFPLYARPLPNDHVIAIGRWIFDCGHAAKTEVHPNPIFENDRIEIRRVRSDKPMQAVRVVRVWMNSSPGAFSYYFDGPFTFNVSLPNSSENPGGTNPFITVVQGSSSRVSTVLNGTQATITITPPARQGQWYWELVLGYNTLSSYPGTYNNYTVYLDKIDVLDDLDHFGTDCGWLPPSDCGEWFMSANINNVARQIFWNTTVDEDDGPQSINLSYNVVGGNMRLYVEGYENDDPLEGNYTTKGVWNLGSLQSLCCNVNRTFQPGSDWKLFYRVVQNASAASLFLQAEPTTGNTSEGVTCLLTDQRDVSNPQGQVCTAGTGPEQSSVRRVFLPMLKQ